MSKRQFWSSLSFKFFLPYLFDDFSKWTQTLSKKSSINIRQNRLTKKKEKPYSTRLKNLKPENLIFVRSSITKGQPTKSQHLIKWHYNLSSLCWQRGICRRNFCTTTKEMFLFVIPPCESTQSQLCLHQIYFIKGGMYVYMLYINE